MLTLETEVYMVYINLVYRVICLIVLDLLLCS